jgi:hypothetical protein
MAQQISFNHEQRDKDSSLSCLIVVQFGFLIRFIWENERSVVQFVTINVKNIRKLISTFENALLFLTLMVTNCTNEVNARVTQWVR